MKWFVLKVILNLDNERKDVCFYFKFKKYEWSCFNVWEVENNIVFEYLNCFFFVSVWYCKILFVVFVS